MFTGGMEYSSGERSLDGDGDKMVPCIKGGWPGQTKWCPKVIIANMAAL